MNLPTVSQLAYIYIYIYKLLSLRLRYTITGFKQTITGFRKKNGFNNPKRHH